MREIKFRAWDLDCGTMRDWEWCRKCEFPFYSEAGGADLLSKEFSLMQFTGLFDERGKEIYEGDIVDHYNLRYVIQWNEKYGCWENHDNVGGELLSNGAANFVVIGNIYENPELIK